MIGVGTRPVYDYIVRPFVENRGQGIFYTAKEQVDRYEQSVWPGFKEDKWIETKEPMAVMGNLRGTDKIVYKAREHGIDYYYFDHAYMYKSIEHRRHPLFNDRYYRITKNGESLTKLIEWDKHKDLVSRIQKFERVQRVKVNIKTYRNKGESILILPPTEYICKFYNLGTEQEWLDRTIDKIKKHTKRPIVVRRKGDVEHLGTQLREAFCVVSSQTTAVIDAIRHGLPSFCEDISCALPVSLTDFSKIDTPYYPTADEIQYWINSMLSAQFSETEIQIGLAKDIIDRTQ